MREQTTKLSLTPPDTWQRIRQRLYNLIWPTEEEVREYRRQLRLLDLEDAYLQGKTDALWVKTRATPPHQTCPCDLCGKYWEGYGPDCEDIFNFLPRHNICVCAAAVHKYRGSCPTEIASPRLDSRW